MKPQLPKCGFPDFFTIVPPEKLMNTSFQTFDFMKRWVDFLLQQRGPVSLNARVLKIMVGVQGSISAQLAHRFSFAMQLFQNILPD